MKFKLFRHHHKQKDSMEEVWLPFYNPHEEGKKDPTGAAQLSFLEPIIIYFLPEASSFITWFVIDYIHPSSFITRINNNNDLFIEVADHQGQGFP